jgi:hypothetical protein
MHIRIDEPKHMKKLLLFLRNYLRTLGIIALAIVSSTSDATSIQLNPALPVPGNGVNARITFDSCVQFDRSERTANRVVIYSRRTSFSLCPSGGMADIALGALNAGNYTIEVFERNTDDVTPPDGYAKVAERRFSVTFGRPSVGAPTKIAVAGAMTKIQSPGSSTGITFAVTDAASAAIPDAPLGLRTARAGAFALEQACDLFRITRDCPAFQTAADGALTFSVASSYDTEGALVTTVISSTIINERVQSAYATVGYIDALRRDIVMPVVEYEIDPSVIALPTRYFLSADDATSLLLDSLPGMFRRTYAAFFGVKPNTPGAVPVCRFFASGKNGAPLTHVFTADAADCAAKKADARYADEGVAFWAYPSSPTGSCPRDTRGVTRYKQTYGTNPADVAFRYSTLLSMRNQAALGGANASGVSVTNDGVAFCVPD